MESDGGGNVIHCSQAKADLLISAQKGHWLSKRQDLVKAKGKSAMQTHWAEVEDCAPSSGELPSEKLFLPSHGAFLSFSLKDVEEVSRRRQLPPSRIISMMHSQSL